MILGRLPDDEGIDALAVGLTTEQLLNRLVLLHTEIHFSTRPAFRDCIFYDAMQAAFDLHKL